MLLLGTKVIVVKSSIKQKVGPKINSTGFICDDHNFANNKIVKCENNKFFVSYNSIIFTRFGNEKEKMLGKKKVVLIFPLIKNDSYKKTVTKVFKREYLTKLRKILNIYQSTPILIVKRAINNKPIFSYSLNDFIAWYDSIVASTNFILTISNLYSTKIYTKFYDLNSELLSDLLLSSYDQHKKNSIIIKYFNNKFELKKLIKNISIIKSLYYRQLVNTLKKNSFNKIENGITPINNLCSVIALTNDGIDIKALKSYLISVFKSNHWKCNNIECINNLIDIINMIENKL